ncbi:MAG: hypothetical protein DRO23_04630 [Thermoprotei archaeon]|nr:MAG: hypothetical protein DRO23_04630 [Thermoprotei archaeon]
MVVITVKFTSIFAERVSEKLPPQIQYHTQLTVPSGDIEKTSLKLKIPFVFNMTTTPLVATITLKGHILVSGTEIDIKNIYEDISKKKKPPKAIFLATLHQTLTEAIIMSREIGIPPPIPLPRPLTAESLKYSKDLTHEIM